MPGVNLDSLYRTALILPRYTQPSPGSNLVLGKLKWELQSQPPTRPLLANPIAPELKAY
jgi:hypothetical protein